MFLVLDVSSLSSVDFKVCGVCLRPIFEVPFPRLFVCDFFSIGRHFDLGCQQMQHEDQNFGHWLEHGVTKGRTMSMSDSGLGVLIKEKQKVRKVRTQKKR